MIDRSCLESVSRLRWVYLAESYFYSFLLSFSLGGLS